MYITYRVVVVGTIYRYLGTLFSVSTIPVKTPPGQSLYLPNASNFSPHAQLSTRWILYNAIKDFPRSTFDTYYFNVQPTFRLSMHSLDIIDSSGYNTKSIPINIKIAVLSNYATSFTYSNFYTDPACTTSLISRHFLSLKWN